MRCSATEIDAFRRWRDTEDADLAPLLAQLRRELPETEPMRAGKAFHRALELAQAGEVERLEADGYTFDLAIDDAIDLPDIRELKATREYVINGVPVTLVGMVDALEGRRVDDHKFTSRWDAERFLAGFQWRIYLEVFGADVFRWNVFEGRETSPRHYAVHALHRLTMQRYPGMAEDVERELAEFVDFAREHLPERFALQVAA